MAQRRERTRIRTLAGPLVALLLLTPCAGFAASSGQDEALKAAITENTLVFPGADGQTNFMHFSRYGTFDWYFPCQIESGQWSLEAGGELHLTYDYPGFAPRTYHLAQQGDAVVMTEAESSGVTRGEIARGNTVPYQ